MTAESQHDEWESGRTENNLGFTMTAEPGMTAEEMLAAVEQGD